MAEKLPHLSQEYIDEYSGYKLLGVAIAFIPIITCFVALRMYARHVAKASWGLDDYLVGFSLIIQIGLHVVGILFVEHAGVGRHMLALKETNPSLITAWAKILLADTTLYFIGVVPSKLAILALYRRLFTLKPYLIAVYVLAGLIVAASVANIITTLLQCQPIAFNWDKTIEGGHCIDINSFFRWCSIPNIVTDMAMLILPMPVIWQLHTSKNVKIGLTLTFLTGAIGLATSIARFATFFDTDALEDGTWASVNLTIWTIVESDVYLIAACLPTYRALLKRFFGSDNTRGNTPGYDYNYKSSGGPSKRGESRLRSDFRKIDEGSRDPSSDTIGLVGMDKHDFAHGVPMKSNEIRVQNDYVVSMSPV